LALFRRPKAAGSSCFQLTPAKSRRREVPSDSKAVGGDQPANGFAFIPQDRAAPPYPHAASAGFAKLVWGASSNRQPDEESRAQAPWFVVAKK